MLITIYLNHFYISVNIFFLAANPKNIKFQFSIYYFLKNLFKNFLILFFQEKKFAEKFFDLGFLRKKISKLCLLIKFF